MKFKIKKEILFNIILALIFFISAYHSVERKLDGNTFIITGSRFLAKDFLSLYKSLGTAPFTYTPQVSQFFSLFLIFGEKYAYSFLIFTNGLGLYFSLVIFYSIFSIHLRNRSLFFPLFLSLSAFSFIINESFFIGQIDLFLLLPLSLFIFYMVNGNLIFAAFLLAFLIQFKPFFLILLLPVFIESLRSKNYKRSIHFYLPFLIFLFCFPLFFVLSTGISLEKYFVLFQQYINTSIGISNGFCCGSVSNSLKSILYNLFSSVPQSGRWYPYDYADIPNTHFFKIYLLDTRFIDSIYIVLTISLFSFLLYLLLRSNSMIESILITLAFVPTFSPVFWFAHLVYLIPVMFYLLIVNLSWDKLDKTPASVILFLAFVLVFHLIQPSVLGGYLVDLFIIYGFYYGFTFVCITSFLFNREKNLV
ncbi:hypothetical protein [Leptospira levettii]|uniref:hypothetical protein n=1 Tax=Leptospira levettii TaxID=2023178 RepID=UPI00223DB760|nr:hypothetical protein [Leptospira levettii]MCW7472072.1 hypothetical protein [Leptospira levettii]